MSENAKVLEMTATPGDSAGHHLAPMDREAWLPPRGARLGASALLIRRFPYAEAFLQASRLLPLEIWNGPLDGVVGWGGRWQARLSRACAAVRNLRYWSLEDGFFRSVGLGKAGTTPVSLVVDDIGVHFAAAPSRLEFLLLAGHNHDPSRARDLRRLIVSERLTKYNHLPDKPLRLQASSGRRILLVDQVKGDASLPGNAASSFATMWEEARAQPNATIVIKPHPDVAAGLGRGMLAALACGGDAVLAPDAVSPHAVLDVVDEVWTVSSQLGLDAILRGIPVVTFGAPFYAGWGLTEDRARDDAAKRVLARRTRRLTIDEFVGAALIRYPIYFDPVARHQTTPEQALERLISWRRRALDLNGRYLCVGFARHKRRVMRAYLGGPHSQVAFARKRRKRLRANTSDTVLVWGDGETASVDAASRHPVYVEDGFLRSVGLGADLEPPSSLCFDPLAPYFDADRPTHLERLLNSAHFDDALLARAGRLRRAIVANSITKYNLATSASPDYVRLAAGRAVIVVAGQVPSDASLRRGRPIHATNLDLLAGVRKMRPAAFIVYKEHPEIVAGHRFDGCDLNSLAALADLIVGNVPAEPLLQAADEVHVATSLFGFEALLRGRSVVCHGLPFYAGWGLTTDRVAPPRPRRRLALDALVAGALILYPRYFSWDTGLPCEAEDVVAALSGARAQLNALQAAWPSRAPA